MSASPPKVALTGAATYDRKNQKFIFESMNIPPCTSKEIHVGFFRRRTFILKCTPGQNPSDCSFVIEQVATVEEKLKLLKKLVDKRLITHQQYERMKENVIVDYH